MIREYVIETFPFMEALASREIEKAGFSCTWLKVQEEMRTKIGRKIITSSLFPSYLFAGFDIAEPYWKKIVTRRGVKQILGSPPDRPRSLPIGALEEIQERFKSEVIYVPADLPEPEPREEINAGDRVLVSVGEKQIPAICKMSSRERVRVLMEYMGGEREGVFPLDRVTLAPKQSPLKTTSMTSLLLLTAHRF